MLETVKSNENERIEIGWMKALEALEKNMPKKATEGDGWEMIENERCCPGDDVAEGYNRYRSLVLQKITNLKKR